MFIPSIKPECGLIPTLHSVTISLALCVSQEQILSNRFKIAAENNILVIVNAIKFCHRELTYDLRKTSKILSIERLTKHSPPQGF
ncbi:protein of unknown function [Vibrio tapetis subsp. tapetis]|uniref:Uncharacterized protein n=1 Tax=Vibrio tapetis subsp. tapetis TaxID=1671868 RepID=A0A2N8Z8W6_9VIBR|nr:protein of unknown function [Vibrio tapetis subsp. tapetis]